MFIFSFHLKKLREINDSFFNGFYLGGGRDSINKSTSSLDPSHFCDCWYWIILGLWGLYSEKGFSRSDAKHCSWPWILVDPIPAVYLKCLFRSRSQSDKYMELTKKHFSSYFVQLRVVIRILFSKGKSNTFLVPNELFVAVRLRGGKLAFQRCSEWGLRCPWGGFIAFALDTLMPCSHSGAQQKKVRYDYMLEE